MLRIAVCDDDLQFLENFTEMITTLFTNTGQSPQISVFSDGKSLIEAVEKKKQIFDIIFLDVNMPVIDGFEVARRLRELNTAFILIFTTYVEHQSREGYQYGAYRYIFKNDIEAETSEAVASIVKKMDDSLGDQEEITFKCRISGVLESLTIKKADIIFLKMEKTRRVIMKTLHADYELLMKPLGEYARQLESPAFVPIMRNYLLNLNHVEGMDGDNFILTGGAAVPLGIKREVRNASMQKYLSFLEERI